jgi:hypothetical protein
MFFRHVLLPRHCHGNTWLWEGEELKWRMTNGEAYQHYVISVAESRTLQGPNFYFKREYIMEAGVRAVIASNPTINCNVANFMGLLG